MEKLEILEKLITKYIYAEIGFYTFRVIIICKIVSEPVVVIQVINPKTKWGDAKWIYNEQILDSVLRVKYKYQLLTRI